MCRFALYLGPPIRLSSLLTEPSHSIIHQSFGAREREEPLNGDGFGVVWYAPRHREPAGFRSVTPAWSNRNLRDLSRVVESHCILAHVRAATQSLAVAESNCHPFTRGRYTFMHNGDIGGFARVRRPLLEGLSDESFSAIGGTTDSEHLFALFMDELAKRSESDPLDAMSGALRSAVARAVALMRAHAPDQHAYLNVAVSDGEQAVVCRFTTDDPEHADSLYVNDGRRYACENGVCRMLEPEDGVGAVLVSSERLSDEPGWSKVPVFSLLKIRHRTALVTEPFGLG